MKKSIFIVLPCFLLLVSCAKEHNALSEGDWWGKMDVSQTEILPFGFEVLKKADGEYSIQIYNSDEVVVADDIEVKSDSIYIRMPIFEGYIAGVFTENEIQGSFIKESLDRVLPFTAIKGKRDRFEVSTKAKTDVSGVWETYFEIDTDGAYPGKGIFMQIGDKVKGTFRTETGDYRYLEGVVDGDSLKLSTFDGAHAFLFTAKATDSLLTGYFYSGNHYKAKFEAKRNEAFELLDANALTFLKEGYDRFDFSFPNESGEMVSLSDTKFSGKPVLVQIMGTWCPNCLDETKFYVDFLKENPEIDMEFIALAFEYAKTEEQAFAGIKRLKNRVGVEYPVLLAQYGTSNKKKANEKLPMLNHVLSYPTTIYIDGEGEVIRIHTGFNGPATGEKYEEFKKDFAEQIEKMTIHAE